MNRAQKAEVIDQLKDVSSKAQIAVVTDFKGMSVEEINDLRARLREQNISYRVVKNTLARIALTQSEHSVLSEKLKDTNAIAFGVDDPVAPAKILADFIKENKKTKLAMKYASLNGQFLDEEALKDLAKLPGREELLASLLGTMNAVPQNFVGLMANVLRGLLNVLTAVQEQKEGA